MYDQRNWPFPTWESRPIVMTHHATEQAYHLGLDDYDVAAILDGGRDCLRGRRRHGTRERCSRWKGAWIRVVVSLEPSGYTDDSEAWVVRAIKPTEEP